MNRKVRKQMLKSVKANRKDRELLDRINFLMHAPKLKKTMTPGQLKRQRQHEEYKASKAAQG